MRRSWGNVSRLFVALVMVSIAQLAVSAGVPTARASAGPVHTAVDMPASGRPIHFAARAAAPLTSKQRAAVRRLQIAARDLHRTVDKIVRVSLDNAIVYDIDLLSHRADLMLAIRNARSVGLPELASRYQRILDDELKRVAEHRHFWTLLYQAKNYGQRVAQKAHDDNPSLPPAVLGNIAVMPRTGTQTTPCSRSRCARRSRRGRACTRSPSRTGKISIVGPTRSTVRSAWGHVGRPVPIRGRRAYTSFRMRTVASKAASSASVGPRKREAIAPRSTST